MITLTSPVNMQLRDWADQVSFDLGNLVYIQRLEDENKWQDWAVGIVGTTDIAQYNVPNPYQYTDWREWADGLFKALQA